ncbi:MULTISPECIES: hypothetical protein [Roseateles]|uniref:Uncharacterized protein n=1 Tax=Roseateles albus TaxID=2987525 RepID=A0ABT5KNC3_9BURK|nr:MULTISPECIES: hypothetical protein [Roseateles]MCV2361060.1 hypothetical protein [Paucibacter sp. TC2R-5]MDC8774346.1 hypothetical protein [Roseateles albus]
MFALSNFIATSQHYFVSPMAGEGKVAADISACSGVAGSYAPQARSSRVEDAAMALAATLAGLTYFTALASAV